MLKWERVSKLYNEMACYFGYRPGELNPTAIVEKPIWAEQRKLPLWTVEIVGRGRIVSGNYDCFSFNEAKKIANREANAKPS